MFDLLRDLSHWFVGFADSEWSVWVLGISSFAESIFFPIPPDPLLIAMAVSNPQAALWLAAIVTVASVGGAVVGHWLGRRFGRPLLYRIVKPDKVQTVEGMFQRFGPWAILIAAFTPIPYKVFAITAGILEMNMRPFLIASAIGRGTRFFLLGALIFVFGEPIVAFIDQQFELVTVLASAGLLAALALYFGVQRMRRSRRRKALSQ